VMDDGSVCVCTTTAADPAGGQQRLSGSVDAVSPSTAGFTTMHSLDAATVGDSTYVTALCQWGPGEHMLHGYLVDPVEGTIDSCGQLPLPTPSAKPSKGAKLAAVSSRAVARRWVAAWSTGELRVYSAPPYRAWQADDAEVVCIASSAMQCAPGVAMAFVQAQAVALFGAGALEAAGVEQTLSVWHSEYASMHSATELKEVALSGPGQGTPKRKRPKDEVPRVQLSCCPGGNEVVLHVGSEVYVHSLALPTLSLASAIASREVADADTPMVVHADLMATLNIGASPTEKAIQKRWESCVKGPDATLREAVLALQDPKLTGSEEEFLASVQAHITRDTPPQVVRAVCDRCCGAPVGDDEEVDASPIFAPRAIALLAKKSLLSARLHPAVIPRCIAAGALGLLLLCLRRMPDLPEHMLVRLLHFFGSEVGDEALERFYAEESKGTAREKGEKPKKKGAQKGAQKGAEPRINTEALRDQLIARLLTVPYNNSFLLPSMQAMLSESDVHRVMRVLHWWLMQHSEMASAATLLAAKGRGPTHAQALDWTAVLLDACFGSVVLSPATASIAAELKHVVDSQVALCEALHTLEEFRHIAKGGLNLAPTVPEYCVEALML